VKEHSRTPFDEDVWRQLEQGIRFVQGSFDDPEAFRELKRTVEKHQQEAGWAETLWFETSEEDPGGGMARAALEAGADVVAAAGGDGSWTVTVGGVPVGRCGRASSVSRSSSASRPHCRGTPWAAASRRSP
ncbi:hypothetical protein IAE22_32050, partial [Bacillus sp. S34]|nr:hypothetical protein [Bacillus sp. S34]